MTHALKNTVRVLALALALCLLLTGIALADETLGNPVDVPDFTLKDQYGNTHSLSDYQGKIVFLNLWATWCGPCVAEMPEFEELYHELGENQGDVAILGVAWPGGNDEPERTIRSFLEENGITYPVLMDTKGIIWEAYNPSYVPFSVFIGPDGKLADVALPDGMTEWLGLPSGSQGNMIVGSMEKEDFLNALESVKGLLPQE